MDFKAVFIVFCVVLVLELTVLAVIMNAFCRNRKNRDRGTG